MATHSNAWRAAVHQHAALESVANYRSLHSSEQRALLDLAEQMLAEIAALESENQEKQAQIDAMRPMVEAVARMTATTGNGHCDSCNGQRVMIYDATRYTQHISDDYEHAADCPIAQARAFVAAHPTAGEAESEGE